MIGMRRSRVLSTIPFFERPRRACCDAVTFWDAFMAQWRKRFGEVADTPDFVCAPAWRHWRAGLTGYESAETCHKLVLAGQI